MGTALDLREMYVKTNISLGGDISSAPSVIIGNNNSIHVFAMGSNNILWHDFSSGSGWTGETLAGDIISAPTAFYFPDSSGDNIHVFARSSNNTLWHNYWNGSSWGSESLGGNIIGAPCATYVAGASINVFARSSDNTLYHAFWNGSRWGNESLGGNIISDPCAIEINGMIHVFARYADNTLWHKYWNGTSWLSESLGHYIVSAPSATILVNIPYSTSPASIGVFAQETTSSMLFAFWNGSSWVYTAIPANIIGAPHATGYDGTYGL